MKQDPKARDELISEHIPYVEKLATKLKRDIGAKDVELDELIAYGTQGLVQAADRFDPSRGVAFTTFSYYRIRGAIYDGLRQLGWLNRSEYARFQAASNDYLGNLAERTPDGSTQNDQQAAADLAGAIDNLATIFVTSLDANPQHSEGLPDTEATSAHERIEERQQNDHVKEAVKALPPKERQVIELYYFKDMTLEQVGAQLGSSKSWVSRLHARAISQLTTQLGPAFP